ncbi:hypothetical protein C5Y96_13010 [Blastopirellula marina]|uniref:STAS/SEC14 domain-containing protein n=1 Tax=Blastopirellula marina TaxID=124 RepID=A0A2S8FGF3_9BACT|nr:MULTISPECIES: hypothetical protein [Pirellulaceae]PQO31258.1 hypothetical protein C5Y96_13010 [Blastopirellula marina]RCS51652.1 hypothetical protein DTL36_13020 [Bremerella cremea]
MVKLSVQQLEHSDYLEFICSGDSVPGDWEELVEVVLQECQRTGKSAVLVDGLNVSTPMDNMTRYRVGLLVAEKFGPSYKIAALTPREHINFFWETVAHNRGAKVKTASDRDTLVTWLREAE